MFNFTLRAKPTPSPTFAPSPSPSRASLPEEVLINILSRLTYDDLRTIRHTSKQFQRLSMDQRVLEGCIHRSWPHLSSLERRLFAQNPIAKFQQVKNFENFQPVHQRSVHTGLANSTQHVIVGNELIGIFNGELRKGNLYADEPLTCLSIAGHCFVSDPDWYYLVTGTNINKIDKNGQSPTIRLYVTPRLITALALRGNSLYVGEKEAGHRNLSGRVVQISTENGSETAVFPDTGSVAQIALDETRLFIGGDETGSLHIWDLTTNARTLLKTRNSAISTFHIYGNFVLTGHTNGNVILSTLISYRPYKLFSGHTEPILHLCWLGGDRLVTGDAENTIKVWCFSSTTCLKTAQLAPYGPLAQLQSTFSSSLDTMCVTMTNGNTHLYHF